jgi:hypothetical protein
MVAGFSKTSTIRHVGNIQNSSLLLNKIVLICKEIENMYQLFRYTCIIFMFREETRLFFTYKFQSFSSSMTTFVESGRYRSFNRKYFQSSIISPISLCQVGTFFINVLLVWAAHSEFPNCSYGKSAVDFNIKRTLF